MSSLSMFLKSINNNYKYIKNIASYKIIMKEIKIYLQYFSKILKFIHINYLQNCYVFYLYDFLTCTYLCMHRYSQDVGICKQSLILILRNVFFKPLLIVELISLFFLIFFSIFLYSWLIYFNFLQSLLIFSNYATNLKVFIPFLQIYAKISCFSHFD